jgi:uncharacterized protein YdeI (YjbR/CyaY-like superfamily)
LLRTESNPDEARNPPFPSLRPPESNSRRNESGAEILPAFRAKLLDRAVEDFRMSQDPRVDDYIYRQADFARPILEHLRRAVHAACPDAEEAIKWGMPHFLLDGKILAGMAAFKAHATFGFRNGGAVVGETGAEREAMGQFGRLASVDDLPEPDALHDLIRNAAALARNGEKAARPARTRKPDLPTPDDLAAALAASDAARSAFDGFSPACRREYVEWIVEAKRPETRAKRIAQAVEWMAEGKRRHWKYEQC